MSFNKNHLNGTQDTKLKSKQTEKQINTNFIKKLKELKEAQTNSE